MGPSETRRLYDEMVREDDDVKRAEIRAAYVAAVRRETRRGLREMLAMGRGARSHRRGK